MANWSEAKPQPSDQVRELGSVVRDNKTHLDAALQKHFYWSDSTLSGGVARFSNATGTFRAYWGTASSFSTTGDSGRLMITSDGAAGWTDGTSYASLRATNFEGALTLSSAHVIVRDAAGSAPATDVRYVIDTGSSTTHITGQFNNTFVAPFSAAPTVYVTEMDAGARYLVAVSAIDASGFSSQHSALAAEGASGMSSRIMWWAFGEVAV